jgi:RNA recognition motif-containing protein
MNIFVGNLPRDITEEDLQEAFGAYGKVATVSVIKDKFTGEPRGFGFVEMPNKTEAQAAIAGVNGKMIKGQSLNVNEARPKTETGGGRGGAGSGSGGGPRRSGGGKRPY